MKELLYTFIGKAHAATYTPLQPIEQLGIRDGNVDLTQYLESLFRGGIIIAGILAVIMVIVGGIQYMTTDAVFQKDEGKKRITAAIGGLILALSSVVLLGTINSELTNSNLSVEPVQVMNVEVFGVPDLTPTDSGAAQNGTGRIEDTKVTTFGGARDVRTKDGYALTRNGEGAVVETDQFGSTWRYALDENGERIKFDQGSENGFVGYDETGSVSGELLRELDIETDLYVAYPLSRNKVAGLPTFGNSTAETNRALNDMVMEITANGKTVRARIIDRGAANPDTLDMSKALLEQLGLTDGSVGQLTSVRLLTKAGVAVGAGGL